MYYRTHLAMSTTQNVLNTQRHFKITPKAPNPLGNEPTIIQLSSVKLSLLLCIKTIVLNSIIY